MKKFAFSTAIALVMCSSGMASAQSADDVATKYAALPAVQDISLSPSGRYVAIVAPAGAKRQVIVTADMSQPKIELKPILTNGRDDTRIWWCDWATEERLICKFGVRGHYDGIPIVSSRMVVMNGDGSDSEILSASTNSRSVGFNQDGGSIVAWNVDGDNSSILMSREFVPEVSVGTRLSSDAEGLGVERIDIDSLKRRTVETARREATRYIADERGKVRILRERDVSSSGQLQDSTRFLYRPAGNGSWRTLEVADGGPEDFSPVAVDSEANVAYGFAEHEGYDAIYSVALDGTGTAKLLLSMPGVDVDQLIRTGVGGKIVGASYATERRKVEFFDKELAGLQAAFRKALPGDPLIEFADASSDGNKLLIIASGDTNPGMIYMFDKTSKKLEEVLPLRGALDQADMGNMTAVTYPAADGTQIPAYLTLPPGGAKTGLPAIVMPHGGPSARDEWGFDWLVQYFVHRGYAVLQPNYRGSSGYGSNWFGENGFKAWPVAIGDVNDAGRWLVSEGITTPDKLAIVGWSYGGYAALQSQVVDPQLYKAVVAVAPVTDLEMVKNEARNYTNYQLVSDFVGSGPHIDAGSPARHSEKFAAPVLMFHGTEDLNVGVAQARKMERALSGDGKPVRLIEFDGLEHSLLDKEARYKLLTETDAFLTKHLAK